MRASLVAGALAAWLYGVAAPAAATLLVYEPFDYDPGVLAGSTATGLNLTGSYAAANVVPPGFELRSASPGLGTGNLAGAPSAAGNRLTQNLGTTAATVDVAVDADVAIAPDSAIFFSALFTLDDSENGNHLAGITFRDEASGDTLGFGEAVVGVRAIRVSASTLATGGLVAVGDDGSFSNGQTLFLFGRYLNAAAAGGDVLELVGYDTADAHTLPASFDPADPNAQFSYGVAGLDIDFGQITQISFSIRGEANNFVDELRIGTSYADIVPEPGTGLLLLTGLAGLGLRARQAPRASARRARRAAAPLRASPRRARGARSRRAARARRRAGRRASAAATA